MEFHFAGRLLDTISGYRPSRTGPYIYAGGLQTYTIKDAQ